MKTTGQEERFVAEAKNFEKIPGSPVAYWVSEQFIGLFMTGTPIEGIGSVRTGMSTGCNDLYLRLWFEVKVEEISFGGKDIDEIDYSLHPWLPYNKGGEARKWYGNNEYVVLWRENAKFHRSRPNFRDIYLKEGLTWSFVTSGMFSARYYGEGFLWDVAGSPCVFAKHEDLLYVLAFLSTKIAANILELINPTLNCQVVDIQRVPIILNPLMRASVCELAKNSIAESKSDWDDFETSWDFKRHPLI